MAMLSPLGVLIERTKAESGESEEDFARRARSLRWDMSKQTVNSYKFEGGIKTLVPDTAKALADGMGVRLERVVEAMLLTLHLPPPTLPEDWSVEAAIDSDPSLTAGEKRMLHAQLAAARGAASAPPIPVVRKLPARPVTGSRAARKDVER